MWHKWNGILLSYKKEWNNATCSDMKVPMNYHVKWSKSDRKRQTSYDITYMWSLLKNNSNKHIYKAEIDS